MENLDLRNLISELKTYLGVTRKQPIGSVVNAFPQLSNLDSKLEILASFGEDAAVIDILDNSQNDNVLLLAADGIMSTLLDADPYWAGYCSVLVNLHDIAAMGGISLALVDVLSIKDKHSMVELTRGINDASSKFGVPIVGGHIHPDSEFNAVDVAILGLANRKNVIYSHTAEIGDNVIFAMDLDGKTHENSKYSWDTTQHKSNDKVRKQLRIMNALAEARLVRSGKDISNPGTLGTLGMLLETSKKGAVINLNSIPYPGENIIDFTHWLKSYQGCGFVITCEKENSNTIIDRFSSVGITAQVTGEIIEEKKLVIELNDNRELLYDFTIDKITGI